MGNWSASIECFEVAGSHSESYDDDRGLMKASATLRTRYNTRHSLVAEICGARKQWPKGAAGVVPRAKTASIVPVVSADNASAVDMLAYEWVDITFGFTTEIVDTYNETVEPYAEFMKLDHKDFTWNPAGGAAANLKEDEAPGLLVRGINVVQTLNNLTSIPAGWFNTVGKVNSDSVTFSILGLTAAAETLLYQPPQITAMRDSGNVTKFNAVKKFTYLPQGFNVYWHSAVSSWAQIYLRGTGTVFKSYTPTAFAGNVL